MNRPMLLDRYMFGQMWKPFAASLTLLAAMLLLESLARMVHLLDNVAAPMPLLGRMALLLLPEYLGIGLLIAPFLATALAVRTFALRGEWPIFATMGVSPARLMAVPLLIGLACATGELVINLHVRPVGEQKLDEVIAGVRSGRYGLRGDVGSIQRLGQDMVISADAAGPAGSGLGKVFLARGNRVIVARSADATYDDRGRLSLRLHDGQAIDQQPGGNFHVVDFGGLGIDLPANAAPIGRSGLDRLDFPELAARIAHERQAGANARPALASLAGRCSHAWIALLMPLLGFTLGTPAQRGRSAAAIGAGLLAIIAYLRLTAFVESRFDQAPLLSFAVLLAGVTGTIALLWRYEVRSGPGAVESWLGRVPARLSALISPARRPSRARNRPAMSPARPAFARTFSRRPD